MKTEFQIHQIREMNSLFTEKQEDRANIELAVCTVVSGNVPGNIPLWESLGIF